MIPYKLVLGSLDELIIEKNDTIIAGVIGKHYSHNSKLNGLRFYCCEINNINDLKKLHCVKLPESIIFIQLYISNDPPENRMLNAYKYKELNPEDLPEEMVDYFVLRYFIGMELRREYFHSILINYTHNKKSDLVNSEVGVLKVICDNPDISKITNWKEILENAKNNLVVLRDLFKIIGIEMIDKERAYYSFLLDSILDKIDKLKELQNNDTITIPEVLRKTISSELQKIYDIISLSK